MKQTHEKKIEAAAWDLVISLRPENNKLAQKLEDLLQAALVTKVIFRKFKKEIANGGDNIIAFFPEHPGTNSPNTCENYMSIGQHGHGEANCGATVPAKRAEYSRLYKELQGQGYKLQVVNKFAPAHRAARVKELNRKYGA